jgi:hypothetical protein
MGFLALYIVRYAISAVAKEIGELKDCSSAPTAENTMQT